MSVPPATSICGNKKVWSCWIDPSISRCLIFRIITFKIHNTKTIMKTLAYSSGARLWPRNMGLPKCCPRTCLSSWTSVNARPRWGNGTPCLCGDTWEAWSGHGLDEIKWGGLMLNITMNSFPSVGPTEIQAPWLRWYRISQQDGLKLSNGLSVKCISLKWTPRST